MKTITSILIFLLIVSCGHGPNEKMKKNNKDSNAKIEEKISDDKEIDLSNIKSKISNGKLIQVKMIDNVQLRHQEYGVLIASYYYDANILTSMMGFAEIRGISGNIDLTPSQLAEIGVSLYDYSKVNNPMFPVNLISSEVITECKKVESYENPVFILFVFLKEESSLLWPKTYVLDIYDKNKIKNSYIAIQPVNGEDGIGFCTGVQGKYISLLYILPRKIITSATSMYLKT